jgi:predicted dehydrogenase
MAKSFLSAKTELGTLDPSCKEKKINICVQGCGTFAEWTMEQYRTMDEVFLHSLVDRHIEKAIWCARKHGVGKYYDYTADCMTEDVDLVYIATPPYVHYEQSKIALEKGKHVLVEKPSSITVEETKELVKLAEEKGLRFHCNLVMRYNPFYRFLREVVKSEVLGSVNSFDFRNYATDQPVGSWFWDKKLSGGIFIEHGVHFFDIMNSILGKGKVVQSFAIPRKNYNFEDRVGATVIYPGGIPGTFLHSFTQKMEIERNYLYLAFERGYLVFYEWIPTAVTGEVWVTPEEYVKLHHLLFEVLPSYTELTVDGVLEKMDEETMELPQVCINADEIVEVEYLEPRETPDLDVPRGPIIKNRHYKGPDAERFNFNLVTRIDEGKPAVYSECSRKCMEDLIEGIKNPEHKLAFSGQDMIDCMENAEYAENKRLIIK